MLCHCITIFHLFRSFIFQTGYKYHHLLKIIFSSKFNNCCKLIFDYIDQVYYDQSWTMKYEGIFKTGLWILDWEVFSETNFLVQLCFVNPLVWIYLKKIKLMVNNYRKWNNHNEEFLSLSSRCYEVHQTEYLVNSINLPR